MLNYKWMRIYLFIQLLCCFHILYPRLTRWFALAISLRTYLIHLYLLNLKMIIIYAMEFIFMFSSVSIHLSPLLRSTFMGYRTVDALLLYPNFRFLRNVNKLTINRKTNRTVNFKFFLFLREFFFYDFSFLGSI